MNRIRSILIIAAVIASSLFVTAPQSNAAFSSSIPVGNLSGWRQTFVEGFNTNVTLGKFTSSTYYMHKFRVYSGSHDTSRHGVYTPSIISVGNGMLTEHIGTVNGVHRVAAVLPKVPGSSAFGQKYGRYSIRMRASHMPLYKTAYLLWPDSGNYRVEGEIDFPENNLGSDLLRGFMHMTNQTSGATQQGTYKKQPFDSTQWHVYTMEWSPGKVKFILDGATVATFLVRIPHSNFHWVLQTETATAGAPAPSSSTSGRVDIDWVAAYAYAP